MNDHRIARFLFLLFLFVYLFCSALRIDSGDGETMYRVAYSMVSGQGFAIPLVPLTQDIIGPRGKILSRELFEGGDSFGLWGVNGHYYAKYGLGWSLAALPFCALGKVLASFIHGFTEGFLSRALVMLLNPFLSATTIALLYWLGRRFYRPRLAVTLAVLYGLGTIAWYYAKSAFSEPLIGLLLLVAVISVEAKAYFLVGLALSGMILTKQTAIFLIPPVLALVFRRGNDLKGWRRWKDLAIPLFLILIGQSVVWGYNAYRFGNPFEYGYRGVAWDHPLWLGLYGLLLSPGKGLLVFSPFLVLGLLGWFYWLHLSILEREWSWLIASLVICYLIPHALYNDWAGGGGWGPRLLLPIVPLLTLPAGVVIETAQKFRWRAIVVTVLLSISISIQVLGVSVSWVRHLQRVLIESADPASYYHRIHYLWADSPILGQIYSLGDVIINVMSPKTRQSLFELVESVHRQTSLSNERQEGLEIIDWQSKAVDLLSLNIPNFAIFYLWFLGAPLRWLVVGQIILGILIIRLIGRLRHELVLSDLN